MSALAAGAGWALASRGDTSADAATKLVEPAQRGREPRALRDLEPLARAIANSQNAERTAHAGLHALPGQPQWPTAVGLGQASPAPESSEVYDVPAILNVLRQEGPGEGESGAEFAPGAGPDSELAEQPSTPMHQAALYQGQSILEQHIRDEELEDRVGMPHGASNDVRVDPDAMLENVPRQPSL